MAQKKIATQENLQALVDELKTRVVHQEEGKGLSTNDLTAELLAKLNGAQSAEEVAAAVAAADHMKRKIVETAEGIDLTAADAEQYIYLVKNGVDLSDKKDRIFDLSFADFYGINEKNGEFAYKV